MAQGITTYSELSLPANMTAELGTVGANQTAMIVPQQNGSFGIFWGETAAGATAIKGIVYTGFGTNWSPSPVITFESALASGVKFQVASTGCEPRRARGWFLRLLGNGGWHFWPAFRHDGRSRRTGNRRG